MVIYNGKKYCLTRLEFELNCAPRIMTKILRKVLALHADVQAGMDSYIDDIVVNKDVVSCQKVLSLLQDYRLEAEAHIDLDGACILGLKVEKNLKFRKNNVV